MIWTDPLFGFMCALFRFLESNQRNIGMLKQHKFLTQLLERLGGDPESVISVLNKIRSKITDPSNLALYFAGNLDILKPNAAEAINDFLPSELVEQRKQKRYEIAAPRSCYSSLR